MIAAVILAAGASRRLGQPKALVERDGEPLVVRAVRAALDAGCTPVVVVLGAVAKRVKPTVAGLGVETVLNPQWQHGMGSSIAEGIATLLPRTGVRAAVVLACDQPHLDAAVVRRLCEAFDGAPRRRVAAAYEGVFGVPALFERALFEDLAALEGDRGARAILLAEPERVVAVDWPAGGVDIDTPDDL